MAPLLRPVFSLLALTCVLVTCSFIEAANTQLQSNGRQFTSRKLLDIQEEEDQEDAGVIIDHDLPVKKKIPNNLASKNQTKTIKNGASPKNQTKLDLNLTTSTSSPKNKTKLIKPTSTSTLTLTKTKTKLNSTSKPSNSTKHGSLKTKPNEEPMVQKPIQPIWVDVEIGDEDLISEFTDLTTRFQESLMPDLEKISSTSKIYIKKANKQITNNVAPIVVFSMNTGLGSKVLSLGQTFVGFAVGLHYYMTVFHRALLHQVPKSSWKVQAVYATCFFVICLFDRFERRKKAYLEEDGSEGKKC
ncbi:hypothetical protein POM88_037833 [Heracleum sosnowskyi]|uniref:Uncharacterized protein n=1 Tax=Heracleum sosnowskyi TaxID=360622 RepID=A0AAD8HRV7_9APIA|nr:hypothetical protein POM88_037833 [Heracleum sosnowskyi]